MGLGFCMDMCESDRGNLGSIEKRKFFLRMDFPPFEFLFNDDFNFLSYFSRSKNEIVSYFGVQVQQFVYNLL